MSIIGDAGLNFRVRNGTGCNTCAMVESEKNETIERRSVRIRKEGQGDHPISTARLNVLPRVHLQPIDVVVYHGMNGTPNLRESFPLRCFQRLSRPNIATLLMPLA